MVKKYRKKPVVIEAIQFVKGNEDEIAKFVGNNGQFIAVNAYQINTLEGDMVANRDDYIIKGVKGEFYPCKPDIFEASYEEEK